MPGTAQTADALVADAAARLTAAGVPDAAQDAERLLRHVLGWDRARLLTDGGSVVAAADAQRFRWLVGLRAARRPLQHLVGTQAFWRHEFAVTPDVLIPRPETEILVEAALARLAGVPRPVVADVGTGSGCIALSVAAELAAAELHAVDVSEPALAVARANARQLGLEARVQFHRGDLLAPVRGLRFDAILSNPPYVDPADAPGLLPEVRDHEPALALFPPGDAYAVYRRLIPEAVPCLRPGGWLLLEVGQGMADMVAGLCTQAGLTVEAVLPDLQGIPRTVVARRH